MDNWSIRLQRAVAQQMASLEAAGVQQIAPPKAPLPVEPNPNGDTTASAPAVESAATASPVDATAESAAPAKPKQPAPEPERPKQRERPTRSSEEAERRLATLQAEVAECQLCNELASTRTQTVFGVGNPTPDLCFFGEAPGYDEDQKGEPFVGAAGQLLTDIIQKGMGLKRSDVYILNVLKCRPPGNRNPAPGEIANCQAFYLRQLEILQPRFICCLGAFAARTLLNNELSVGRMRGKLHDFCTDNLSAKVCVTYHPAYLLRTPEDKRKTWEDVKMLMRAMGVE